MRDEVGGSGFFVEVTSLSARPGVAIEGAAVGSLDAAGADQLDAVQLVGRGVCRHVKRLLAVLDLCGSQGHHHVVRSIQFTVRASGEDSDRAGVDG